ncbi:hypothetical protein QT351_30000 (plasmid) [Escherichia coli]|nr:hypothetical protein [Escherichia coli]
MNKISAPRFLHLQIAENLPANLAAWAQSINDVQAWLVSFLIQHTSLTASKAFSETASEAPSLLTFPIQNLTKSEIQNFIYSKKFF